MNLLQFFGLGRLGVSWSPLDDRWYQTILSRRTAAGVAVDEDSAKNYSAVWACTRLLAGTGSALPLNLYRQDDGGGKAIARNHPTHYCLHTAPNPRMGSMAFRSLGIDRQVNRGNFYAEIERDMLGRATALWPIHPSRIPGGAEEVDGELVYKVQNNDGTETVIAAADMFHVPSIITRDGINGIGVITAARESVGFGMATEKHGAAYFGNGARPSIVLKHPGKIKDKEYREELRRQWNEIHQGPENAGKVALLQEGMEAVPLGISNEDSQFLQTRQHNVEEIARWYGVPPHLIGHLLRSTYNNIEVQSQEFVTYSLMPWLVLWEQEIDRKLIGEREQAAGLYAKHVLEGLLRGDMASRAAFYKSMWELGVFSSNDILGLEDRNPIGPDGDKRFVPMNFVTLDQAGQMPEPAPAPELPAPEPTEEDGLLRVIADRFNALAARTTLLPLEIMDAVDERLKALPAPQTGITNDTISPLVRPLGQQPNNTALAAAYAVLDDTVQRFLSKEQNAARRLAAKSAGELFGWLDPFYEKHESQLAEACLSPCRVILALEGKADDPAEVAAKFARAHAEQSREELLAAMECQESELAGRVNSTIDAWKESRRVVFTSDPEHRKAA